MSKNYEIDNVDLKILNSWSSMYNWMACDLHGLHNTVFEPSCAGTILIDTATKSAHAFRKFKPFQWPQKRQLIRTGWTRSSSRPGAIAKKERRVTGSRHWRCTRGFVVDVAGSLPVPTCRSWRCIKLNKPPPVKTRHRQSAHITLLRNCLRWWKRIVRLNDAIVRL